MLSLKEAAQYLSCSQSSLRKTVRDGRIRYYQPRKHDRIKFKPQWLEEFLAAGTHDPMLPRPLQVRRPTRPPPSGDAVASDHGLDYRFLTI